MYPSLADPSIFRNKVGCDKEWQQVKGTTKTRLKLKGYEGFTNVQEARVLLDYYGDNEELLIKQSNLQQALIAELEDKLYYELEVNNVSAEELSTNQKKMKGLLGLITGVNRARKEITLKEVKASTPELSDEVKNATGIK